MTASATVRNPAFTGNRKSHKPREAIPLRWPKDKKERLDLFDAWHDVAMQIVQLEKDDFRLLAAVRKVFMFSSGDITASNREIAWRAGHCADKTVTRAIQRYADLGLFVVTVAWKAGRSRLLQTRKIRLALPTQISGKVQLPEGVPFERDTPVVDIGDYGTDTRGPADSYHRTDTRGPGVTDTRGPGISRDTRRKGSREESLGSDTVEPTLAREVL